MEEKTKPYLCPFSNSWLKFHSIWMSVSLFFFPAAQTSTLKIQYTNEQSHSIVAIQGINYEAAQIHQHNKKNVHPWLGNVRYFHNTSIAFSFLPSPHLVFFNTDDGYTANRSLPRQNPIKLFALDVCARHNLRPTKNHIEIKRIFFPHSIGNVPQTTSKGYGRTCVYVRCVSVGGGMLCGTLQQIKMNEISRKKLTSNVQQSVTQLDVRSKR